MSEHDIIYGLGLIASVYVIIGLFYVVVTGVVLGYSKIKELLK